MVALTTSGRVLKRHFDHAIKGEDVLVALKHFRRHLPGPLIIVWDHLSAHQNPVVKEWIASQTDLYVEWLPPYAPTLNPEELCHGNVKRHLHGATPASVEQLRKQVDREFARLRKRPALLASFFEHAGLKVVNFTT